MWSLFKSKASIEQQETKPRHRTDEPLRWFVVAVNQPDSGGREMEHLLTPLAPAESANGLPPEAIAGRLTPTPGEPRSLEGPDRIDPAGFTRNRTFHDFLHHVIAKHGPTLPDLVEDAKRQGDGSMAVIDLRTPEGIWGNVPGEDVIGLFAVQSGKLGEYHANEHYCAVARNGLMRLEPSLCAAYRRELLRLCEKQAQS